MDEKKPLVGIRDQDEAGRGLGLRLRRLIEVMIGVAFSSQTAVGSDDALPIDRLRQPEDLEESPGVGRAGAAVEQRSPTSSAIGLRGAGVLGVIDIVEREAMPQPEERVRLKAEREIQLQNRSVLRQRDRTVLIDHRGDRMLQKQAARLARSQMVIALAPARDVDPGGYRRESSDGPETARRGLRGISAPQEQMMDDRGGDDVAAWTSGRDRRPLGARDERGHGDEQRDDQKSREHDGESDDLHGRAHQYRAKWPRHNGWPEGQPHPLSARALPVPHRDQQGGR